MNNDSVTKKIPRSLHYIWVGDQSKRPDNCIESWKKNHPCWRHILWGNEELSSHSWINLKHISEMSKRELNGVADLMRWEILFMHGGVLVDADSYCLRPLEEEFLEVECFSCWENEIERPGLIAAGYFGSVPKHPLLEQIISDIKSDESVVSASAWQTVGPLRLTKTVEKYGKQGLKIFPSYYFIPEHYSGRTTYGIGPVYANQFWGSTRRIYDQLHMRTI